MKALRWLSYAALCGALLNRLRIRSVWAAMLYIPRLFAGALLPLTALVGGLTAWLSWRRDLRTWLAGMTALVVAGESLRKMTQSQPDFEAVFGDGWRARLSLQQQARMLRQRWTAWLPEAPTARVTRDVVYWTLADGRELCCDIIQPPAYIPPSGLALIYAHGSAWHYGDKGLNPGFAFEHLAAQGHLIMNVGYRLAPETDCAGMIGDLKRAVAYMKAHAAEYHVNPERIVLSGASAGGHLALMAAYTADDPQLTPEGIDSDTSVRGIISYYGVVDLRSVYDFAEPFYSSTRFSVDLLEQLFKSAEILGPDDHLSSPEEIMRNLLGCLPDEDPEAYRQMSPLYRAGPGCPPTLLLHGEADWLVPVEQVRRLHTTLCDAGVQTVYVEVADADHGFDLFLPRISPPAQIALYTVERFLALLA